MITLTLVRHGESIDNLKSIWAGWKDAPLSNHGLNQAKACGEYFSDLRVTAIFASPLKRALTTAQQIQKHQKPHPGPPLTITPLIREQHFGEAEGNSWSPPITDGSVPNGGRTGIINPKNNKKVYPVQIGREAKFPAGESPNDVAARTGEAFETFVMPFVRESVGKKAGEVNIFFVSHGIAISETIGAIFSRAANGRGVDPDTWRGLKNTAWTRMVIGMEGERLAYSPGDMTPQGKPPHEEVEGVDQGEIMATMEETANPPTPSEGNDAPREIVARVVAVNQHSHLHGLVRQGGGVGSMAHDENQKAITDFFGGGAASSSKKTDHGDGKMETDEPSSNL